jgi:hypothetical protein
MNFITINLFRFTLHGTVIFLTIASIVEYRCHIIHKAAALSCTEITISNFLEQKINSRVFFLSEFSSAMSHSLN